VAKKSVTHIPTIPVAVSKMADSLFQVSTGLALPSPTSTSNVAPRMTAEVSAMAHGNHPACSKPASGNHTGDVIVSTRGRRTRATYRPPN